MVMLPASVHVCQLTSFCDILLLPCTDANIGIGVSIFSERESEFGDLTILWVYLAFVVFAVVLNSVLLLLFTGEAVMKGDEGPVHNGC